MYAAGPDGSLFGTFAPPTVVGQQPQVAVQTAVQPPRVERHVTVHRSYVPETHVVQVPKVIPTQHTVVEAHPYTVHEAHTIHEPVTHTVVDQHTVLEPRTVTVPHTIVENHTVVDQVPRTVIENHTILVPRTVVDTHTVKEPHTVLEAVQRVVQVPRVVPEAQQIQVPRTEYHQRQVVQQVARTVLEPRQVVQQVPRTVFGQRTVVHQHQVQTARVVETPHITEIERPQIIQHVIPGRARQYAGPPRFVGQVHGGVQHVGTVDAGHTIVGQTVASPQFHTQFAAAPAPVQQQQQQQFASQQRLVSQPVAGAYPSYGSFGAPVFSNVQSVGFGGFPQYQGGEEEAFRA